MKKILCAIIIISAVISCLGSACASEAKEAGLRQTQKKPQNKAIAQARAYVDKSTITIGEKVKYTLEVDYAESAKVELPAGDNRFGGFTVKDFGEAPDRKIGAKRLQKKQWFLLDTYTLGSYVIPEQEVKITLPGASRQTLKSPQIFVEVKSVIKEGEKEEGLRDIKPPLNVPFKGLWLWIAGAGAIIIAGIIAWFLYSRRKTQEEVFPVLAAHEAALKELERIEALRLLEEGKIKDYYYLVNLCLRAYLEARFALRAPEQTTEEFLQYAMSSEKLQAKQIKLLKDYLYHCDLVKYAEFKPALDESRALGTTTRCFVEETKEEENNGVKAENGQTK